MAILTALQHTLEDHVELTHPTRVSPARMDKRERKHMMILRG